MIRFDADSISLVQIHVDPPTYFVLMMILMRMLVLVMMMITTIMIMLMLTIPKKLINCLTCISWCNNFIIPSISYNCSLHWCNTFITCLKNMTRKSKNSWWNTQTHEQRNEKCTHTHKQKHVSWGGFHHNSWICGIPVVHIVGLGSAQSYVC